MSVLHFPTRSSRRGPGLMQSAGTMVAGAVQAWRARRADRAMSLLSDEMLHDIGVSRGEIFEVVRHGRPRRP
jgi:uncharacterized protein YjiS (DUF1127 family)